MPSTPLDLRVALTVSAALLTALLALAVLVTVGVLPALLLAGLAIGGLVDTARVQQRRDDSPAT